MKQNLYEIFYINDLTPEEQNDLYDLYKISYEKSVGNAWDKYKFFERAEDWYFFGDQTGYVAARLQGSGIYKLAVVGGNIRGILKGIQELISLNKPTWGMVSSDILPMLKKLGFKTPNALTMNALLRLIPKEVFGGVDFKINLDGSITLNYEDTGSAKKYFVGNQQYFDWLKSQIKDKMNPLKLTNLLKEVLQESKQVGNLYHFTNIESIKKILDTQYLIPNDEKQVSTSIRANMDTTVLNKLAGSPICRLMLDGDKISTKYKIRPFDYDGSGEGGEDVGEEQIIVDGNKFYFLPYLKRIDIFTIKNTQTNQLKISKTVSLLEKMNIPYKIYEGNPGSNIPYKQPKEGNPKDIKYTPKPKEQAISILKLYHPYPNFKSFIFTNNPETYPLPSSPTKMEDYPQYLHTPLSFNKDQQYDLTPVFPDYYVAPEDNNVALFDLKHSKKESESIMGMKYMFGRDYTNPITQKILKSIKFKTWKELGMEDEYNKLEQEYYKKYKISSPQITGLMMLPKKIADEYLITKEVKPYDVKHKFTPKNKF